MIIRFLIEKEFKQILRDPFLPKLIFMFPIVMMLLIPFAINMDIKNIKMSIIDHDHSSSSMRLTQKIASSSYFKLTDVINTYDEGIKSIEAGRSDAILEIPANFEKQLVKEGKADVMIAVNTVNGTRGILGNAYLNAMLIDFSKDLMHTADISIFSRRVDIRPTFLFNPQLSYKVFMIPALVVMLMTLLCGFLPALNIVSEKEKGSIEQINVSPVNKFTFILGKLIPYWVMGFIVLTICFLISAFVYHLIPSGSFFTLYFFASLFILVVSGLGLVVSIYSDTLQQAMFLMFFFIMLLILISGLFTPISSMPKWAQAITVVNPLTYFVEVMRMVFLKGSNIMDLGKQWIALSAFAVIFNTWAGLSYRKSE